ncbi:hypothetical protein HYT92_02380 [Candidatus Pacearchaeota archaeon]|nr:hypothetical protein [Candidatus Pacearchaeota archaeon]
MSGHIIGIFANIGRNSSKEREYMTEEEFEIKGRDTFIGKVFSKKWWFWTVITYGEKTFLISEIADLLMKLGGAKSASGVIEFIEQQDGKEILLNLQEALTFIKVENKEGNDACRVEFGYRADYVPTAVY